jgi:hypothetical protein
MSQHISYRETFAANVAGYLILGINLHNDFGWRLHEASGAARTLVIISLAAEFAKKLRAFLVLAFQWLIDNFLAATTEKILVEAINRWRC